jgi:nitrogen fixation protein FixH
MATVRAMNDNGGFRLTGRMVLLALIGFFGTIMVANVILVWLAVSTNSGVVVASSYKAGNAYQADLDAAKAQAQRHWTVTADIARSGDGATFDVTVRDAAGAPVGGLALDATLASHVSDEADHLVTLAEGEVGRYRGVADTVAPGNWLLVIDATRGDDRVYHSENRVMLR